MVDTPNSVRRVAMGEESLDMNTKEYEVTKSVVRIVRSL